MIDSRKDGGSPSFSGLRPQLNLRNAGSNPAGETKKIKNMIDLLQLKTNIQMKHKFSINRLTLAFASLLLVAVSFTDDLEERALSVLKQISEDKLLTEGLERQGYEITNAIKGNLW